MNLPTFVDAGDSSGRLVLGKSTTLEDSYKVWKPVCLVKARYFTEYERYSYLVMRCLVKIRLQPPPPPVHIITIHHG